MNGRDCHVADVKVLEGILSKKNLSYNEQK